MSKSYSKIKHIQNSNIILEQRYLKEESSQMFQSAIIKLSDELGNPIDPKMAKDAVSCSYEDFQIDQNQKPEVLTTFQEIKQKIKDKILSSNREELKTAYKEIIQILKSNKDKEQELQNSNLTEQTGAGLLVATTVLGVTAPLWVWVAVGAVVLYILLKAIISLSSWIPRSSGHGCGRTKIYRVR